MGGTYRAVKVEPGREAVIGEVGAGLNALQEAVGGHIQLTYPFDDPVAILCNDEGKLLNMPLNRALCDEDGGMYDIICGTFYVVGVGEDDLESLSEELAEKYRQHFRLPEHFFVNEDGDIAVLKVGGAA